MDDAGQCDGDVLVELQVEVNAEKRRRALADDGRDRCAGDAEPGESEQTENQNRIQNDIDDGAGGLQNHTVDSAAGRLQKPFVRDLEKQTDRAAAHNLKIGRAVGADHGILCLSVDKRLCEKQSHKQKNNKMKRGDKQSHSCCFISFFKVLFSERAGEQCVDSDAHTGSETDHQVLQGKSERYGCQCALLNLCDKDAVHHVVQCLNEHGNHHGK